MVQPIDYLGMLPRVDLGESIKQGMQIAGGIRDMRAEQQQSDAAARYAEDLRAVMQNPTAQGFAALTAKYPQQREAFKQSWEMLDKGQQDAEFGTGIEVYSALQNNKPEIAVGVLDRQIEAMKNSGQNPAKLEAIRDAIGVNPKAAGAHIGLVMSATDPDRWSKMMTESRAAAQAPAELSEAQAKAYKAGIDAKFAESKAAQDLEKGGWDIAKLQSDIQLGRENARIAAMNAAASREGNDLKRAELLQKVQDAKLKRDETVRLKADEAQTAADTINNISSLIGSMFENEDALRAATGASGFRGMIPGTEARTMAGKVDQLKDILASANLDKLKGPMSDKDIEFVRRIAGNLDRYQDEEQFIRELKKLNDFLPGTMDKMNAKYGSNFTLYKNEQAKDDQTGAPPPGAVRRIQ